MVQWIKAFCCPMMQTQQPEFDSQVKGEKSSLHNCPLTSTDKLWSSWPCFHKPALPTTISPSPENSREDGDYLEVGMIGMKAVVRKNVGKLDQFLGQAVIQEYTVSSRWA